MSLMSICSFAKTVGCSAHCNLVTTRAHRLNSLDSALLRSPDGDKCRCNVSILGDIANEQKLVAPLAWKTFHEITINPSLVSACA